MYQVNRWFTIVHVGTLYFELLKAVIHILKLVSKRVIHFKMFTTWVCVLYWGEVALVHSPIKSGRLAAALHSGQRALLPG